LKNRKKEHYLATDLFTLLFCPFQHDAACRVIARLKKERDDARALLAQAERQIPASVAGAAPAAVVSNGKRGTSCLMFSILIDISSFRYLIIQLSLIQ
jgi:pre-mRNA-processing factor 19